MKRKVLFVFALIATLFSVSCSQEDDIRYSCDEAVDSWVKRKLPEIRSMSREQWKELDPDIGLAAYRAFTPEQRIEFWKEKFAEVKALPWTEEELLHIQQAEDYTFSCGFLSLDRELTDKEKDELNLFFYKWAKFAEKDLGWEPQLIYAIVASGYSLNEEKTGLSMNNTFSSKRILSPTKENYGNCNCNSTSIIECGGTLSHDCRNLPCNTSRWGCGVLWMFSCDGFCLF